MFTGLVEEKGKIVRLEELGDSIRMSIEAPVVTSDATLGDSISVNGVCLTVAELEGSVFVADIMQESLNRSALGQLDQDSAVNLERALLPTTRLGGHIVQGHVDGTSKLISRTPSEHWEVLRFELPQDLDRYVVGKGSIAISGTSLTISALGSDWFEVSLIPVTLQETILGDLSVGDLVNLEVDVLAKYVEKMVRPEGKVQEGRD
ncbi:riboflavin synthase [Corynebacterium ammoniagenes]|uniref:Riboflavin synthase n=1 Tax=Corynebacterium ammoniagenes DSM 20306 TaxID=649754 RepID=A0ABN0AHU5_CORAM|nr:riboflavin synthase [Corynebacterium ammoniagenes]APT82697.1 riboflavin synthase subunit alpha [Corynebacterium ammoniagenes DSM 20306]AQS73759.1 riboflavin synthase [Corynebacterium ammoniagenes]EFG82433.1 riboflavin synthase, alpha subunit [Corynebacterium ammoniagenes DSM 20306]NMF30693.1 riboflavin synthase [Corynebacterium ammoniagenes]